MSDQFDLGGLLQQAQAMQAQLLEAQAKAAEEVVEGESGGGVVKVRVTGGLEFQSVTIDPKAVDPDDVETLQDLIVAAVRDAARAAGDLAAERMGPLTGGLGGLGLGGPGLPGR